MGGAPVGRRGEENWKPYMNYPSLGTWYTACADSPCVQSLTFKIKTGSLPMAASLLLTSYKL